MLRPLRLSLDARTLAALSLSPFRSSLGWAAGLQRRPTRCCDIVRQRARSWRQLAPSLAGQR
eukprot:7112687-Prymnesium_polylepis.1